MELFAFLFLSYGIEKLKCLTHFHYQDWLNTFWIKLLFSFVIFILGDRRPISLSAIFAVLCILSSIFEPH